MYVEHGPISIPQVCDLAVHGFRSKLKDWACETTDHPRKILEAALAPIINTSIKVVNAVACKNPGRRILAGNGCN